MGGSRASCYSRFMIARQPSSSLFEGLRNHFGPLQPSVQRRLRRVLLAPDQESWDDAYNIILRSDGLGLSLWQAVKAVDPDFAGTKRAGRAGWLRVPDQLTIARALRFAREAK